MLKRRRKGLLCELSENTDSGVFLLELTNHSQDTNAFHRVFGDYTCASIPFTSLSRLTKDGLENNAIRYRWCLHALHILILHRCTISHIPPDDLGEV